MATEAQRLIGISLSKIAQSRAHRGGVSLHKNLLVATVLQKARYIFMEEAYHMVQAGTYCPPPTVHVPQPVPPPSSQTPQHASSFEQSYDEEDESLVALTPEEAGISDPLGNLHDDSSSESSLQDFLQTSCVRCTEETRDKENVPPYPHSSHPQHHLGASELTYIDLDKSSSSVVLKERSSGSGGHLVDSNSGGGCLKRRRAITEWETEEAVLSILPKRSRHTLEATEVEEEGDDSVFLDEAALFSDCVAREAASSDKDSESARSENSSASSAMEIDRITSLVSIFSFGGLTVSNSVSDSPGKLSRSVSTPDLCSAQAKESAADALQQRPFLAMTV